MNTASKYRKYAIAGAAGVGAVAAAPVALSAAGFTAAGVAAGSFAAWIQVHNICYEGVAYV